MNTEKRKKQKADAQKRWRRRHPEKAKEADRSKNLCDPERHKRYRVKHPIGHLLTNAKRRAKRDGLSFDLKEEDFLPLPSKCPILGITLDYNRTSLGNNSPSIDKVEPALGYIKGNVHIISNRANQKKSDWTLEELERLLLYMKNINPK